MGKDPFKVMVDAALKSIILTFIAATSSCEIIVTLTPFLNTRYYTKIINGKPG